MRRICFAVILAACAVFGMHAETVSQKQAQQMAQLFFNQAAAKVTAPPKLVYNGRRLTTNRLFTPFYVYNTPLGGFVIISAENKSYPILGYSLKESFDPDLLGDSELALMKSYAMEIEMVKYDTQPIESTIWAWQHYPEYIERMLKERYTATDPRISIEEANTAIENSIVNNDAVYSDLYTPSQWLDMIGDELVLKESVPVSFIGEKELYPAIIYGRKGDYFRIEMASRNEWLMRLNATEVIASNMVTIVRNPIELQNELEVEEPFETLDSFLEEVAYMETLRSVKSSIDFPQRDEKPFVVANGGGHFEISIPENVISARIYNLSGAMVRKFTYKDTYKANIDISAEPSGFYFVTIEGESGTPYGLKLYR